MPTVYVSFGSNQSPRENLRAGLSSLEALVGPVQRSPVYRNPAVGFAGDDFYNLVAAFETSLPLTALAQRLREIERQQGRHRGEQRFAPRTLDMDILAYGDLVGMHAGLNLPRADILDYAFVLRPLADLAPQARHPALGTSYAALWAAFDQRALELVPVPGFLD